MPPPDRPWQDLLDFWLRSLDEGWSLGMQSNETDVYDCAGQPFEDCVPLLVALFSEEGGFVLVGRYEFGLNAWAWEPQNTCGRGCNYMGGNAGLAIVPEPATGMLVLPALSLLAWVRRASPGETPPDPGSASPATRSSAVRMNRAC